jgi:ribosomal protein S18 acetylase RimI-like enzyme
VEMASIRNATLDDYEFLQEVLTLAFNWRPEGPQLSIAGIMSRPEIRHYISGWPLNGDVGVVAETERPIGAAWWRFLPEDHPGYGFVDSKMPEITIGVLADQRGKGTGRSLLDALICTATEYRLPGLSLSVEPDNYALRLYEKMGFEVVGGHRGAVTMRRDVPAT